MSNKTLYKHITDDAKLIVMMYTTCTCTCIRTCMYSCIYVCMYVCSVYTYVIIIQAVHTFDCISSCTHKYTSAMQHSKLYSLSHTGWQDYKLGRGRVYLGRYTQILIRKVTPFEYYRKRYEAHREKYIHQSLTHSCCFISSKTGLRILSARPP